MRRGPARFEPATKHRDELFASLSSEQRPIAERLADGGLPGLRKAISDEQQRARTEGRAPVSGDSIIAVAEQIHGDVKAAVWLDRAEAALAHTDEITLRDLRTTVVSATPRDEAGRELERTLREALERRVTKLREDWERHLAQALEDGKVLQALRLSAKPPEPTARFPGALVVRLAQLAGEAMTEESAPDRWLALLAAAVESPVRRQVKPAGVPKDPNGEVERQARMAAGRMPALARLLGMAMPPPPKPIPGERIARPNGRPTRRPGGQHRTGARPIPAPPSAAAPGSAEPSSDLVEVVPPEPAPEPERELASTSTDEVRPEQELELASTPTDAASAIDDAVAHEEAPEPVNES